MSKLLNSTTVIILGVIVFLVGCIQPSKYEKAKENGYEVDATIVEVVEKEETDSEGSYSSTSYTAYADYEVDGKEYKHVKVGKNYQKGTYYVGKVIKVVVNPNAPNKPMFEGGILCVIGFLVACGGVVSKIKKKKAA